MAVKVTNTEARVHSIGLSAPRDFITLRPGDTFVSDATWLRAEKAAADLVNAGTLKVEKNVNPPAPAPVPAAPSAEAEEAADEAEADGPETKHRRRRY